jgi:hypothetical protein
MPSTLPDGSQNRFDQGVVELGRDDRQLAALIRIAEAVERLADDLESNHRAAEAYSTPVTGRERPVVDMASGGVRWRLGVQCSRAMTLPTGSARRWTSSCSESGAPFGSGRTGRTGSLSATHLTLAARETT